MVYILVLLVGLGIAIYCTITENYSNGFLDKFLWGLLNTFMGLLISALVCLIIGFVVEFNSDVKYEKYAEDKIVALQDNSSVSGNFYLGSGNINGTMKYVYMTESNGGFNMHNVGTSQATVVYSSDNKVEGFKAVHANKIISFLFGKESIASEQKYKLYVPEGTIKQNFNIDLK